MVMALLVPMATIFSVGHTTIRMTTASIMTLKIGATTLIAKNGLWLTCWTICTTVQLKISNESTITLIRMIMIRIVTMMITMTMIRMKKRTISPLFLIKTIEPGV